MTPFSTRTSTAKASCRASRSTWCAGCAPAPSGRLIAAGGIAGSEEVDTLAALGADAVVGMAVYSGRLEA